MLHQRLAEEYQTRGFAVERGLFSPEEVARYRDYFMAMVHRGGDGWAEGGVDPTHEDPLKRYPRLLQPHRGDGVAFGFMVDERFRTRLTELMGQEPFAVQTMVYFKPPGARGQALHQDNAYLRVEPGTCAAAWLALDDCDLENGCMEVVPGSQGLPMICPGEGDPEESFTGHQVPVPPGMQVENVVMKAGDVMFFNGSLIHGSKKNRSDRFRRIMVGHYIAAEAEKVGHYYFPVYRFDGTTTEGLEQNPWGGGPCGVYREGELQMFGSYEEATGAH